MRIEEVNDIMREGVIIESENGAVICYGEEEEDNRECLRHLN